MYVGDTVEHQPLMLLNESLACVKRDAGYSITPQLSGTWRGDTVFIMHILQMRFLCKLLNSEELRNFPYLRLALASALFLTSYP